MAYYLEILRDSRDNLALISRFSLVASTRWTHRNQASSCVSAKGPMASNAYWELRTHFSLRASPLLPGPLVCLTKCLHAVMSHFTFSVPAQLYHCFLVPWTLVLPVCRAEVTNVSLPEVSLTALCGLIQSHTWHLLKRNFNSCSIRVRRNFIHMIVLATVSTLKSGCEGSFRLSPPSPGSNAGMRTIRPFSVQLCLAQRCKALGTQWPPKVNRRQWLLVCWFMPMKIRDLDTSGRKGSGSRIH